HARIAREITRDVVGGLVAADAEVARQAERAHAVHQAEVDGLGGAALVLADIVGLLAEHLGGGGATDVGAFAEGALHALVAGQVRHDPQFDLRVVRGQHLVAGRGDEGLADAPALGGAHRDVLQVGVGRGQAAGGHGGLVIAGVHAAGARVDDVGQFFGIGRAQFGQAAVIGDPA